MQSAWEDTCILCVLYVLYHEEDAAPSCLLYFDNLQSSAVKTVQNEYKQPGLAQLKAFVLSAYCVTLEVLAFTIRCHFIKAQP